MSPNPAIRDLCHGEKLLSPSIESTVNCLTMVGGPTQLPELNCGSTPVTEERSPKTLSGRLLAVSGNADVPIEGAMIEVRAVTPLKRVAATLPKAVLTHCRTLLLEAVKPLDLYHASKHIADKPLLSFADVQQLQDIPGYELLAAAARSQGDDTFKRLLCSNPTITRLLLCYYHSASFSTMHVADATTNAEGFFQCGVIESSKPDEKPGYLFIARHKISTYLHVTLYNPVPLTWYTHWDLPTAAITTLRTQHPLALCKKPPNRSPEAAR